MRMRLVCLFFAAGCSAHIAPSVVVTPATQPAPGPSSPTIELEPLRIDVSAGGDARAYDARSLFDEGNDALLLRKYDQALAQYEHLFNDFADSKLVPAARYNAAQAFEGKEDWAGAATQYRALLRTAPDTDENKEERKNAHFRLAAVLAELGQFAESIHTLEQILDWPDLAPDERVEGLARLGFALVETRDYAGAEEVLRSAIAYHLRESQVIRFESSYFVAMAQFYLGEIPHDQFRAVPLRYPEAQMRRDVERKAQLFLLARERYVKTIDYRSPYWATAAVFQVATLYKEFWNEWMAVPIPADFTPAEAQEYVKQVNEQPELRKLLEKALFFHEKNIAMARNANTATAWSRQSEQDVEIVRKLLAQQQHGDYITPGIGPASATPKPVAPDSASVRAPAVYIPPRLEL